MHRRTIEVSEGAVRWTDDVAGTGVDQVVGRIPLHPSVRAERVGESAWRLALPSGDVLSLAIVGMPGDAVAGSVRLAHEDARMARAT